MHYGSYIVELHSAWIDLCHLRFGGDLPIVINFLKMLCFHQSFMKSVVKKRGMQGQEQKDISTFYCTLIIYRNIIRYKAGMCLMLIGSEFVLASIVFSFFYRNISELFLMFVRL